MGPMQATARALLLLCCLLASAGLTQAALPTCSPQFSPDGQHTVVQDCIWHAHPKPAHKRVVIIAPTGGVSPSITLDRGAVPGPAADYSLTLKRVVLRQVSLSPANGASGLPRLLPLGLFSAVPRNISLYDVRLLVAPKEFQEYLTFFKQQLRTSRDATGAGPSMHTDNVSILNVPYWSDNTTEVFSLSLVSGPCLVGNPGNLPWSTQLQQFPSTPGCNMRLVDNRTLVGTLLRDAARATATPLLIRLTANVTLGPGLLQSIAIQRPVVLLGMVSALTSVDLGMVVNQLNVTLPYGKLTWQSLVLENLAPGDAVSSSVAPPFSTTVSSNVWAMYCNRSASSCVNLNNVTLIVPTQEELNYQVFMYTLWNSPAPALRDLTDFYRSELSTSVIQFVPGPGNDTLTVIRLLSKGWDLWYVVVTLKPFLAPQRPLPRQAAVMQRYRAGALVYALQDCEGFVKALSSRSTSTRPRVWTLINNISIADNGHVDCPWPDGNLTYATNILGPVVHTHGLDVRVHASGAVASPLSPEAIVLGHADADTRRTSSAASDAAAAAAGPYSPYGSGAMGAPSAQLYALSFGYVPGLFQLAADAPDKYLQIQSITLRQLPQMLSARSSRSMGRLLQADDASPIGIWSVLLWPIKRSMLGVPVTISDSQLLLPQPEWDALANEARQAPSFALQLQGQAGGLTFTGVTLVDNGTMRVGGFQGPGIAGTNLWLLPDPEAAQVPGYSWPSKLFESSASSSASKQEAASSLAVRVGVGVAAGVLGLTAAALGAWMLRDRVRARHGLAADGGVKAALYAAAVDDGRDPSSKQQGGASRHSNGVAADVVRVQDAHTQSPAAGSGAAAAGVAATASLLSSNSGKWQGGSAVQLASEADSVPVAGPGETAKAADADRSQSAITVEQTIATGLERWNAAVSMTTLQLMQRRLQSNNAMYSQHGVSGGCSNGGSGASSQQQRLSTQPQASTSAAASGVLSPAGARAGSVGRGNGEGEQGLQLHSLIGTGSFGSVYLGSWRGKRVAIKVMHLQNNALLQAGDPAVGERGPQGSAEEQQQERLQRQRAANSPPHMAIMEAVVSSAMSHPNVVQVFTYMLNPLTVQPGTAAGRQPCARELPEEQQQQRDDGSDGSSGGVFGWQLRLVMQHCEQGTLRDALDKRRLPRLPGAGFPHPTIVFSLGHDVASAMLHLHSEGIVHGDLKAGNVLLTSDVTPGSSAGCSDHFAKSVEVWAAADSPPLSGKVADFGLATPLLGKDTHATMLARGTPTHMAPELFMSGHVSKASDVYAFGILLYELITGLRAYAGVPMPLLPHEVAVQGLRPVWPRDVPQDCHRLRELAEACWSQKPQDRPAFEQIMRHLEDSCAAPQQQQQDGAQQQQQQAAAGEVGQAVVPAASRYSPVVFERKGSKDQLSWSEISYGGSKHNGGWS